MTNSEFTRWRRSMGFTLGDAAKALELSQSTIQLYEAGRRFDNNKPVPIPRVVELACLNLSRQCLTQAALEFATAWDSYVRRNFDPDIAKEMDQISARITRTLKGLPQ